MNSCEKKRKLKSLVPFNFSFQTRSKEGRVNGNETQIKFRHTTSTEEKKSRRLLTHPNLRVNFQRVSNVLRNTSDSRIYVPFGNNGNF